MIILIQAIIVAITILLLERAYKASPLLMIWLVLMTFCAFSFAEIQYYTHKYRGWNLELRTGLLQPCEVKMYKWWSCDAYAQANFQCSVKLKLE